MIAPNNLLVKVCLTCEKIEERCKRYPYGRGNGIWCPYAECNCEDCVNERRPLRITDLRPDKE